MAWQETWSKRVTVTAERKTIAERMMQKLKHSTALASEVSLFAGSLAEVRAEAINLIQNSSFEMNGGEGNGARPARDAAQVKAGGELLIGARISVFANFNGEFARANQLYSGIKVMS